MKTHVPLYNCFTLGWKIEQPARLFFENARITVSGFEPDADPRTYWDVSYRTSRLTLQEWETIMASFNIRVDAPIDGYSYCQVIVTSIAWEEINHAIMHATALELATGILAQLSELKKLLLSFWNDRGEAYGSALRHVKEVISDEIKTRIGFKGVLAFYLGVRLGTLAFDIAPPLSVPALRASLLDPQRLHTLAEDLLETSKFCENMPGLEAVAEEMRVTAARIPYGQQELEHLESLLEKVYEWVNKIGMTLCDRTTDQSYRLVDNARFLKIIGSALGLASRVPLWKCTRDHYIDIASYVLESDEFVNIITSSATDELKRTTGSKYSSFASALEEALRQRQKKILRQVVEALYLHLKNDYHLRYEYERGFDEATGEQCIRIPALVRAENRGTCVDLVTLFLGCLANVKLWPIYIQIQVAERRGHAVAATWLQEPPYARDLFLEANRLRKFVQDDQVLAIDCTGFVEGYPQRQYKLSFEEACIEAKNLIFAKEVLFALDIRKAWEGGIRVIGREDKL